jgi:hypothetical protein
MRLISVERLPVGVGVEDLAQLITCYQFHDLFTRLASSRVENIVVQQVGSPVPG